MLLNIFIVIVKGIAKEFYGPRGRIVFVPLVNEHFLINELRMILSSNMVFEHLEHALWRFTKFNF